MGNDPANSSPSILPAQLRVITAYIGKVVGSFVPEKCRRDPDHARRASLIAHFGIQGATFGLVYAVFYHVIGHDLARGSLSFAASSSRSCRSC